MQNLSEEQFKQKYLKYKNKYNLLKGGFGTSAVVIRGYQNKPKPKSSSSSSSSSYSKNIKINDYSTALSIVEKNGMKILDVDSNINNFRDIAIVAVKQNGLALKFISINLQNDRDIVEMAVKQNGLALKDASPELKNDSGIIELAIQQNGQALKYASSDLRNNKKIVKLAVENNSQAIYYASDELQGNITFIVNLVKHTKNDSLYDKYKMYYSVSKELLNEDHFKNKIPDIILNKEKYENEILDRYNEAINVKCTIINISGCSTIRDNIKFIEDKINELNKIKDWDNLNTTREIKQKLEELKIKRKECNCM